MSTLGWVNPVASALLRDIDAWAIETKCTVGDLGTFVLNHPGFVPLLRKRGSLNPGTADLMRDFMRRFPDAAALPTKLRVDLKAEARSGSPWRPDRHTDLMRRHRVREDASAPTPEAKPRISAAVIRSAKLDGRDLPTFVTALIEMGLECWRDDRVAHGETVA